MLRLTMRSSIFRRKFQVRGNLQVRTFTTYVHTINIAGDEGGYEQIMVPT